MPKRILTGVVTSNQNEQTVTVSVELLIGVQALFTQTSDNGSPTDLLAKLLVQ